MDEIKPCPFCGGSVERRSVFNRWFVQCLNADCQGEGPVDLGESGAIEKWNAANEPMPCGHPRAAVTTEGDTQFCRWCADLDAARKEERERCARVAVNTPVPSFYGRNVGRAWQNATNAVAEGIRNLEDE